MSEHTEFSSKCEVLPSLDREQRRFVPLKGVV
jgi:hypothetical protein